jgi:hypothetical protein
MGKASPTLPMERMILLFRAAPEQQAALDSLALQQQDPSSPSFHQWLTPETYATHFGVSARDRHLTLAWLTSHGFRIDDVSPAGRSIIFSGTAADVEEAFHTEVHEYLVNNEQHYANATELEIPAALSNVVDGVVSMDNVQSLSVPLASSAGNPLELTSAEMADLLGLSQLYANGIDGNGVLIAAAGRSEVDLSAWGQLRSSGYAVKEPEIIVNGIDPGYTGGTEESQVLLNLEWIGAAAPQASLQYVISASTNATDGALLSARYIVDRNQAAVASVNFGLCETGLGGTASRFVSELWEQAAVQGITVVVPAGGLSCHPGGNSVNALAATSHDLAVGNAEGNGSGSSKVYCKPSWQSAPGVPDDGRRDLPDLTLGADTRVAAPVMAGAAALLVQTYASRQGSLAPRLYALARMQDQSGMPELFRSPDNQLQPDYSKATGLGALDLAQLVLHWNDPLSLPGVSMTQASSLAIDSRLRTLFLQEIQSSRSQMAPILFYTDLDSGPATGGEGGTNGAFLCVYGENFGSSQGSSQVSVGGVNLVNHKVWSDPGQPYLPGHYAKACGQIAASTPVGPQNIVVTVGGVASSSLASPIFGAPTFTVRAGSIYFAATTGSDSNAGTSAAPFLTARKCKDSAQSAPGGICYLETMTVTKPDSWALLWLEHSGTALSSANCGSRYTKPCGNIAIVAYPGETVTFDATVNNVSRAFADYVQAADVPTLGSYVNYWTVAGLTWNGGNIVLANYSSIHSRVVDNAASCTGPGCAGAEAGGIIGGGSNIQPLDHAAVYGNRVNNVGCNDLTDTADYFNYLNSAHPCSWLSGSSLTSSGTTIMSTAFSDGVDGPYVIQVTNPNATGSAGDYVHGPVQIRRLAASSTTPCLEVGNAAGYTNCVLGRVGSVYVATIDQPFYPDITTATKYQFRYFAPEKTEHNVYFDAYTYYLDFAFNEIDGSEGHACRGFQLFHDAVPNNHDIYVHHNYIHDTVCDGINMNAYDASFGPVQVYDNLIVNAGGGLSATSGDLPGGGAMYSGIYMSGAGSSAPYPSVTNAGTLGGVTLGSTTYSYQIWFGLSGGTYKTSAVTTTTQSWSHLTANTYNTISRSSSTVPSGATSWGVVRYACKAASCPTNGLLVSKLPLTQTTWNDTGVSGDGNSYGSTYGIANAVITPGGSNAGTPVCCTTKYSYSIKYTLANGNTLTSGAQALSTGWSSLSASQYNIVSVSSSYMPYGLVSWTPIRTSCGGSGCSTGALPVSLSPAQTSYNDTGAAADGKSYPLTATCINSRGQACAADVLQVFNNTIVNSGQVPQNRTSFSGTWGAIIQAHTSDFHDTSAQLVLSNNLIVEPASSGIPYWRPYTSTSTPQGATNLCYGEGDCETVIGAGKALPATLTAQGKGSPNFTNTSANNYHIGSGSAAMAGSSSLYPAYDLDGTPQTTPPSTGAYTFDGGISPSIRPLR